MPGFPAGGLTIDKFSPGVNVVYGPNASGKTTLAKAMQKLLWPDEPPHEQQSLIATLQLDNALVSVDYDLGQVRYQREGLDADLQPFGAPELHSRYILALHDMIAVENDSTLAARIVRESVGGYDVNEARQSLEFRDRPRGKSNALRAFVTARDNAAQAENEQRSLDDEQHGLIDLKKERDQAGQAKTKLDLLNKALAYVAARDKVQLARTRQAAFPNGIALLRGDEEQRLKELRKKLESTTLQMRQVQAKYDTAETFLGDSVLPIEGVSAISVSQLRLKCQHLAKLASTMTSSKQELAKAYAELSAAEKILGSQDRPAKSVEIDANEIKELFEFARRAEKSQYEHQAAEELRNWLRAEESTEDAAALEQGISLLRDWTFEHNKSVSNPYTRPVYAFLAGGSLGLLAILMAIFAHWTWLGMLFVAFAWITWAYMQHKTEDRFADIRQRYESLPIAQPDSWSDGEIARHLWQLQHRAAQAAVAREKASRWESLDERAKKMAMERSSVEENKRAWAERLGCALPPGVAELYLLAERIHDVKVAERTREGVRAELDSVMCQHDDVLQAINSQLEHFGLDRAGDADEATAAVEQLDLVRQDHEAARRQVADAGQQLKKELGPSIESLRCDIAGIFATIGLAAEDEPLLHEWSRKRKDYLEATRQLELAQHEVTWCEAELEGHDDLKHKLREELELERLHSLELGERWESLNSEITGIETRIGVAKRRTDLESAIAERDQCADALREMRAADGHAMVGNVLADFLTQQERTNERSMVFQRASELFVQITNGRYRLKIDEGDPPAFRALDTAQQVGLALDQLSSGTRLQLLLAVRVAFLERQEHGVKLPLVLDETLANSDDQRAEHIIESAVKICQEGRQVFYFTAQHDEVGKWQSILARYADMEYKLIDLAELRGFSETDRVPPMDIQPPEPPQVPAPDGTDWLDYGRRLDVPPINPLDEPGGVHLWYLIDNVEVLHRLLKHGINRWGQLQTLVDYGRIDWLRPDTECYQRIESAGRVVEHAIRYWRIGRGRPVNRQTLVESNAVSERFLDPVGDLVAECRGDAQCVLDALGDGHVQGFRGKKRDELRDYMINQGFLDESEVLTLEQIVELVRPVVFTDMENQRINAQRFEHLVSLVAGAEFSPPEVAPK